MLISITYKTTSDLTFGKAPWTQQLHNTFFSPKPLFFFCSFPLQEIWKIQGHPWWTKCEPCSPHSSIQACPTSLLIVPCRGIQSSRSNMSREPRWSQFPSEACLASQTSAAHLAAGTKFMTATPQTCPRLSPPAPHQSMGQAEFSCSISEPTGQPHQLLVVQNHQQLRNTDVVPSRETGTLSSLFCLKKPPPQTKVGGGRGWWCRETERGEGSSDTSHHETPSLLHFHWRFKTSSDDLVQFDRVNPTNLRTALTWTRLRKLPSAFVSFKTAICQSRI